MAAWGSLRRLPRLAALGVALAAAVGVSGSAAVSAEGEPVVRASLLPRFDVRKDVQRFGSLDYVGGFSYASSDPRLMGVSSIRLTKDRSEFLAVTDTGYWFSGTIRRDEAGRPIGIDEAALSPILGVNGMPRVKKKGDADAEGLAITGDRVLVSYERTPRIESFARPARLADVANERPRTIPAPIPRKELRSNAGMETIAVSPRDGRIVVITEQSLDENGDLFAAILGAGGGVFKVKRDGPWHVTDGAFLPDGDLVLLERRYEGFGRVGMRLRRIEGGSIRPGALVDGPVLIDADLSQEIDNMEGLDASVGADGSTYLTLVSDNNGSFFQRNLFLEFRLTDQTAQAPSD
ncbi:MULTISPECIES: esterase-like activity of phytase family protein [unclassified Aureimonas]|uniref:esterase-like activity of phytase family protein n=1 Tax=unclassified Aureimonas TaxID=2615206 RepID=UPI0006F3F4C8|nr:MULTISPECIES: esterase-like activity of phytase family protein [unclassified Aureimonas]KQT53988.1 hypothetical protein ASG62_12240 [Aureimonas sp. Leaf427]KQT71572.1 hypothetical protein ASG54_18920 [Aureimonas sp. Leaf460]